MERKIEIEKGRIITRAELFRAKRQYHKNLSQIPFEEKIRILMQLRKIAELRKKIEKKP